MPVSMNVRLLLMDGLLQLCLDWNQRNRHVARYLIQKIVSGGLSTLALMGFVRILIRMPILIL